MTQRTPAHRLKVATVLHKFIEERVLPGTGVTSAAFWQGFDALAHELGPKNAALRLGLELNAAAEDRLMNQYRHLSSFPENREVLAELKARGIPAGILSNGDPEMLGVAVKSAGFSGLLAHVLSVHALRKFKTDPAAYALGPQALNLPAKDILFVSSNGWDAIGATWYGYTTLWVNRFSLPLEQLDTQPTRIGTSLRDVLDFFPI